MTPSERIAAIAAADVLGHHLDVRPGPVDAPDWVTTTQLATDGDLLDARLAAITATARTSHPGVSSGWLIEKIAWHTACLAAASLVLDRSVPGLHPDTAQLRFDDHGLAAGLAVPDEDWLIFGPDQEDLAIALALARLEAHLAPLVEELVRRTMRPRRALWRQAGDRLAAAFLWFGVGLDRLDEARRLGERTLAAPSLLAVEPQYTTTDRYGPPMPWRARVSCCLAYHVPEQPLCAECPRQPKA